MSKKRGKRRVPARAGTEPAGGRSARQQARLKRRQRERRNNILLAVGLIAVVGAVGALIWWRNQPTPVVQAPALTETQELLPLADPVNPIHGWHDMPNIPDPNQVVAQPLSNDQPQPNISIPATYFDFGVIGPTPDVQQTYYVQNTGSEPLLISNVTTSCGCTTADLSSSVIPPGRRADLVVTYDPDFHKTFGPVTRVIWIESNDPDTPVAEVRFEANVQKG